MYGIYQIVKLKSVAIHTYIAIIYVASYCIYILSYNASMHACTHSYVTNSLHRSSGFIISAAAISSDSAQICKQLT